MPDLLGWELSLLVARLRDFSPTRYAAPATPFPSRAAALWHLAGYFVAAAGIERPLPVLPAMTLADVLAVVGHDLCTSRPAEPLAAAALAEVLLHRYEVDGSLPGARAAAAVLEVLAPTVAASPRQLLRAARLRCPAYQEG
jgi:hypothetical protein